MVFFGDLDRVFRPGGRPAGQVNEALVVGRGSRHSATSERAPLMGGNGRVRAGLHRIDAGSCQLASTIQAATSSRHVKAEFGEDVFDVSPRCAAM